MKEIRRRAIKVEGECESRGRWAQRGLCHGLGWCSVDPFAENNALVSPRRKAACSKAGSNPLRGWLGPDLPFSDVSFL